MIRAFCPLVESWLVFHAQGIQRVLLPGFPAVSCGIAEHSVRTASVNFNEHP